MEDDKQVGGVQIILERMKTHPEDFAGTKYSRRWLSAYEMALSEDIAKADEILALHQGMKEARRTMFTEKVLKLLAEGDSPQEAETIPSPSTQRTGTVLGGATLGGLSGITNGGTVTLNPAQNAYQNHLAHQQAHYLAQQATATYEPNDELIQKLKNKLFGE